jgi:hypothetical protein
MPAPLYIQLARTLQANQLAAKAGNLEQAARLRLRLTLEASQYLPKDNGFDSGTLLVIANSTPERLVFDTAYHHKAEGKISVWSEHRITALPSLQHRFTLHIAGQNENNFNEEIGEIFYKALWAEMEWNS